ncbi:ATP-binding protein [Elizabethkingia anophelis]|nr:ATP-binding protein [Elizabethkingia anophelis]MCT4266434.1 ATP-binding protein [Elizabethkingia anophelis]MCT4270042.1 ATP-binding protein [Elizabethkingia anophelis]
MKRNLLFTKSFDKKTYECEDLIDFLLEQISLSEENLEDNLEKIRVDFFNLTDHSLEHSLMLWNYAYLIMGENMKLNPLEAYVLHMCFLIHDAGMCFSILNNKEEIEKTEAYKDYVSLNKKLANVEKEALFYCVRKFHGDFAERITGSRLSSGKMVIEDENLRDEFAHIIGKISKSHSCDIAYIDNELEIYTKPTYVDMPIDCKKLAFILRCSDAAHIDNLRTPLPIREIKSEIDGVSQDHWVFQKKIGFPKLKNGHIVYTSNTPFESNEKKAWWLCYEALRVLDNELKKAQIYFLENDQEGFIAKGVKGLDSTLYLGENYIKTNGWKSIDTKVKVSNPKLLTTNVGGMNLYGNSYSAIRELLQNAFDALKLRKIKEEGFEGKITVILQEIEGEYILEIKDNGIGMSKNILCNQLLDFGTSYWRSYDFYDEYVGIAREQFKSIGKFGIGFFSVFMLGKYVEITSVKYGEDIKNKYTLIFEQGLFENPILQEAKGVKLNESFGTTIKIKLDNNPYERGGFIKELNSEEESLYELIRHLVPSPAFDIEINDLGTNYILPKDLIDDSEEYSFKEILSKFHINRNSHGNPAIKLVKPLEIKILPILQDGEIVAQLGIIPKLTRAGIQETCLVISNGIRVTCLSNDLIGYIKVDEITNLVRNEFEAKISYDSIYQWGINYIEYMKSLKDSFSYESLIESLEFSLGIYDKTKFCFIYIREGSSRVGMNEEILIRYLQSNDEFIYYDGMGRNCENYSYYGFFPYIRGMYLSNILIKEDTNKLINIQSYFENLLVEIWGGFTKYDQAGWDDFALELDKYNYDSANFPYGAKTTYRKK